MNSRRQLLKLLGMAPAAAVGVKGELAAMVASPAVIAASAASIGGPLNGPAYYGKIGEVLGKQLDRLRSSYEAEIFMAQQLRVAGLDHDIAALKSTARGFQVRKQIVRDLEGRALMDQAARLMWG